MTEPYTIRTLKPTDDMVALTDLVHRAYGPHAQSGLRFFGTYQSVGDTITRVNSGETFVIEDEATQRIVATVTLRAPSSEAKVPLYRELHVWTFAQFCVDPALKGQGIGSRLHEHVKARARERGGRTLALDTAAPATKLIAMYKRWGYRIVGATDWRPTTNYESVVMALEL